MGRIRTFTTWAGAPADAPPEAKFGPSDLNLFQDEYEVTFARWRPVATFPGSSLLTMASGVNLCEARMQGPVAPGATAMASTCALYLDPADLAIAPRTTQLRITADISVGATAPTGTWTFSLKPVTAFAGASGAIPYVSTVGTDVAGSTAVLQSIVANTRRRAVTNPFAHPAAGHYALAITTTASAAAGTGSLVTLEYRHV